MTFIKGTNFGAKQCQREPHHWWWIEQIVPAMVLRCTPLAANSVVAKTEEGTQSQQQRHQWLNG